MIGNPFINNTGVMRGAALCIYTHLGRGNNFWFDLGIIVIDSDDAGTHITRVYALVISLFGKGIFYNLGVSPVVPNVVKTFRNMKPLESSVSMCMKCSYVFRMNIFGIPKYSVPPIR